MAVKFYLPAAGLALAATQVWFNVQVISNYKLVVFMLFCLDH